MNYTLEHLKIVHNAGAKKLSFDKTVELISLLDRNGLLHLVGDAAKSPSTKGKVRRRRNLKKLAKARDKAGKRRGRLSDKIVGFLKSKGSGGAHVKDVATALKTRPENVTAWFYGTGKPLIKSGKIKKVGPATFAHI